MLYVCQEQHILFRKEIVEGIGNEKSARKDSDFNIRGEYDVAEGTI